MIYLSEIKQETKKLLRQYLIKLGIFNSISQISSQMRIKFYRSAITFQPQNAKFYCQLAKAFKDKGDFDNSLKEYKQALAIEANLRLAYLGIANLLQEKSDFKEIISILFDLNLVEDSQLKLMLLALSESPTIYHPSRFWVYYLVVHTYQLKNEGIKNFKRTVNQNYFQWITKELDKQLNNIKEELGNEVFEKEFINFLDKNTEKPLEFKVFEWEKYQNFLCLLWELTYQKDHLNILKSIEEPLLGNPLTIKYRGSLISQDICNSVLEINAAMEGFLETETLPRFRVAELGAGYGRIAYVLLQTQKNIQVTIIDIPPALYISQLYLTNLFPNLKVFKYRNFSDYQEIQQEFEKASIAFISGEQIEKIPDKTFDLFINVSSLHEMTKPQINLWFSHIDRVCKGFFYSKQWIESCNERDNIIIHREDYPVKAHWQELYNRNCFVQKNFFEALYSLQ